MWEFKMCGAWKQKPGQPGSQDTRRASEEALGESDVASSRPRCGRARQMGLSEACGAQEKRRTVFTTHWVPGREACLCHTLSTLGSCWSRYPC